MKPVTVLDVASLPDHAFGNRSILWWGTLGFMATEGMAFALAAATGDNVGLLSTIAPSECSTP